MAENSGWSADVNMRSLGTLMYDIIFAPPNESHAGGISGHAGAK